MAPDIEYQWYHQGLMNDTAWPPVAAEPDASGRFALRIDPGLHAALRTTARQAGISLNELCRRKLSAPDGVLGDAGLHQAIARAVSMFGEELVGIAAYGSWARGEARPDSDLDLLIVLREGFPLRRSLYDDWDASPLQANGLPVEPSIVRLPNGAEVSGLWAEVAIDGIVIFDPELRLSRCLSGLRKRITEGELVGGTLNDQRYWSKAHA